MRRNRFVPGDDAVSPVVGVVLLVAIAVTLTTTVGVFVLGFGPGERAPNGELQFTQNSGNSGPEVNVTVVWADGLDADEVTVQVEGESACPPPPWSGELAESDEVTVTGYGCPTSPANSLQENDTVRVVWTPEGESREEVLGEFEVF